ncbi:xyloglucan 6-xylosyltransferase 2-like [Mangifera indica]|uniref:xyloglucan 6-xylosyltransferase 2-like n=1 Tax=Mangifera indica TaxID=29780 RepID=UPI001CFBCD6C|nr:xyloglucan 6-xylosyltransferase 2-like [Mangifera indica]XP_044502639.1 xyloglucan 6-xylosyltransferase 2-like [Mangifera indica]
MMERCLGVQRSRKVYRALRNCKVTVLCLVLTVVVLRGIIGAGKFGTPEQDLTEIRNHFYFHSRKRGAESHRVLKDKLQMTSASSETSNSTNSTFPKASTNYNEFDFSEISDDKEEDEKPDWHKHYSLGPKISDWDERKLKWLKDNSKFSNFVGDKKPRVLLVTGSSPRACENPVGDHYLLKSVKNKIDYCRIHGIEIFYNTALLDAEMAGFWEKLLLLRNLMLSHPAVELFWWMDSEAVFTDMTFEVPWNRYKDYNLVMHGWNEMVYDQKKWTGLNTGSFVLRNCQWSLDILDSWASMGPKGIILDRAGEVLNKELTDRPSFKAVADDQSAMVYLLANQRDKWGDKVYLESEYYLHGDRGILVDRYEERIEKYHSGLVDHRWPLVTHFVGCKPCAKFGDYPVERCSKQMDRAFNFGDYQILKIFGFTHNSLVSKHVKRIRNGTSNQLEVKNQLGLLQPSFKKTIRKIG